MRQKEYKDKKIAVIGIGGVGGYTAAILAVEYPNVTAAARGRRGGSDPQSRNQGTQRSSW